jgi:hypothetical protein
MMERPSRPREAHHEQPQTRPCSVEPGVELAEIEFRFGTQRIGLRDSHLRGARQMGLHQRNEPANRGLTYLGAMLRNEASPCRIALLLGHLKIICQPANNDILDVPNIGDHAAVSCVAAALHR